MVRELQIVLVLIGFVTFAIASFAIMELTIFKLLKINKKSMDKKRQAIVDMQLQIDINESIINKYV